MSKWVRACDAPESWEGQLCWHWRKWYNGQPGDMRLEPLIRGYSRKPEHCKGVWLILVEKPLPPRI